VTLLWFIPLLPLLGAIINGALSLGGARSAIGPNRGFLSLIAVAAPAASFVLTLIAATRLSPHGQFLATGWTWLSFGGFHADFSLLFDHLTSMMLLFVTGIGTLIHLYSVGYMWEDRGFARFMSYMNLFMFSMIMLVMGANLPVTFLGWEGVGLCSYLLVGFWHHNNDFNDAARKAFVMNRIGDLGFLLGAFALVGACGSLDYRTITTWFQDPANTVAIAGSASGLITLAGLLIFFGCTGKSAQIPLLTWLPDAMAGPTPVSALIHAATMVTSGVYLVARLGELYVHADPAVLSTILVVGCLTAVYGAIAGLFQLDIKKALAYSTVSQLGFMFMAAGVGAFDVSLFHVFTHAFFKATLFLGAGAIIHALHHEQDMRRMGGLHRLKPLKWIAYGSMLYGWYAIVGLPLGSGFMSKDLILERLAGGHSMISLFGQSVNIAPIIAIVALLTALVTAVYMTRVMVLVFWSPSRLSEDAKAHVQGTPFTMALPLVILGFGSLCAGFAWFEMAPQVSLGFDHYLAPVLGHAQEQAGWGREHHAPYPAWMVAVAGSAAALVGAVIAWGIWGKGPRGEMEGDLSGFGARWTWAFDRVYHVLVVLPVRWTSLLLYWVVEQALIGGTTYLVAEFTTFLGDGYASVQRSRLRTSLALSVVGLVAILWLDSITVGVNHLWVGLGYLVRLLF
jgi:NADH-quinone oxidoreductase subunit L